MLRPQIQTTHERLDARHDLTGRGVTIAFVDIGFYPHPDLVEPARRIKAYADVVRARPLPEEFFQARPSSWHGTMTACVAAGSGYTSGGRFRGLASEADVVLLRAASESGRVEGVNVASALRFPLRHPELGVQIVSVSLGVNDDDPGRAEVEAALGELADAGIIVVAAAGNNPDHEPLLPAASHDVIAVGGSDDQRGEVRAWPSSFRRLAGPPKPDLVAPAILVPAPMLPGTSTAREARPLFELISLLEELDAERQFEQQRLGRELVEPASLAALRQAVARRMELQKYISPDYQHVDGTSFAAPVTAAVIAQMLQVNPRLTPTQIKRGLTETANFMPDVEPARQGAGVLRPRAAVAWADERRGDPT